MNFPNTPLTLIQRIALDSKEEDWQQFLRDYWRPLCRFSARWGRLSIDDAEDVTATTLLAIVQNQLLPRWVSNRKAKLRTLLCSVARNVLANRARHHKSQSKRLREHQGALDHLATIDAGGVPEVSVEEADAFFAAWAEELLQAVVEALFKDYSEQQRGDYFRVLYGRICEGMTMREVADNLRLSVATAENYYKHARKRLGTKLEKEVRRHVTRYSPPGEVDIEYRREWGQLSQFLQERGGLEDAIQRSYQDFDSAELTKRESTSLTEIFTNVHAFLKSPDEIPTSPNSSSAKK